MFDEATQTYTFKSEIRVNKPVFSIWNEPEDKLQAMVKDEPMFFRADLDFAEKNGGPLTKAFVAELRNYDKFFHTNILIDSRVHMLFPGWYPSIPGFHLDSVPRELGSKQPNHKNPSYQADHCMMLVGDASKTEFALGDVILPEIKEDEVYYKEWHPQVEKQVNEGKLKKVVAEPGQLIFFDWQAWHQGVKATKRGFRLFIRATAFSTQKVMNEIRRNAQVYLEAPMNGW